LLLAAAAILALAACNSSSTTGPRQLKAGTANHDDDVTCRSGYHVATRIDGTQECVED
jgi:hypothetical protein